MSTQDPDPTTLVSAVLEDGFSRIEEGVRAVVDGLRAEDLTWVPEGATNSIGWLLWHLCRQQDAQLSHLAWEEEAWTAQGWADRFDLPYDREAMGYGQDAVDVRAFRVADSEFFTGYARDVHALTVRLVRGLGAQDYGRVVDTSWDPPVTMGVRVYSVLEDSAKHLGQAEYLRGMLDHR